MELVAAEPLVIDPVAAAFDEDGRLYVVEMSDYPHVKPENDRPFAENTLDPPVGRLKLLTDRDGDGIFDASTILAEKLSWPTGVVPWKGGVFVAATPSIWYIKDADGDGRAEVREEVFRGFRKYNIQAVMNNLQWGPDHAIYGAGSGNGGEVRPAGEPNAPGVSVLRKDFRFRPERRTFEAISGGARFGNTFDDWGNRFLATSATRPSTSCFPPATWRGTLDWPRRGPSTTPRWRATRSPCSGSARPSPGASSAPADGRATARSCLGANSSGRATSPRPAA
jgi:putative membrane-bound dehydrogenase-like protein